jgi:hypothetical protein
MTVVSLQFLCRRLRAGDELAAIHAMIRPIAHPVAASVSGSHIPAFRRVEE